MNQLKIEWHIFQHAIIFFSRIPTPQSFQYDETRTKHAVRYLPLIGYLVGLCAMLVFLGMNQFFSLEISIFFSMLSTIILTGALHEDGFVDFCDSLGGMTIEKRLNIMKDSNMGAYGGIGLWSILSAKYIFLTHIPANLLPAVLISGHVFSRFFILFLMIFLPYAGKKEVSKSVSLVETIHIKNICIASAITGLMAFFLPAFHLFTLPVLSGIILILYWYFKKSLGGYTGDYLGAAQQMTEVAHYLCILHIC